MSWSPRPPTTADRRSDDDDEGGGATATQWFVVSDLGLTAFSGRDGVHVFVRSLASAAPLDGIAMRLVARNNEVLATKSDREPTAMCNSIRVCRAAPAATRRASSSREDGKGDYGFLDLGQTPFDLSRSRRQGPPPAPSRSMRRFSPSAASIAPARRSSSPRCCATTRASPRRGLPMTIVVKRPDGVEYKRTQVDDQGEGGRSFTLPLLSGVRQRHLAVSKPMPIRRATPIGDTSFLVEDYVPETLDFTLKPQQPTPRAADEAVIETRRRAISMARPAPVSTSPAKCTSRRRRSSGLPALHGYQRRPDR